MSKTAQEVFNIACALIDEVLDDGTISASDTISYSAKTPRLLNLLQAELLKQGDVIKVYNLSNKPIDNLLSANFNVQAYTGDDISLLAYKPAKAYYFESDRAGTVYIEDYTGVWNTLATITTTYTAGGFTAYKGIVTPTSGATLSRIRFSGDYYYNFVNTALFNVPFASSDDVPDYRPYVKKSLPTDFKAIQEVIIENPMQSYGKDAHYKLENKSLYVNYYYNGNMRILYYATPTSITSLTDTMQVDDVTATLIVPYGLAAHLMLSENPTTASYFNQRYEELRLNAIKSPSSFEPIVNVYGGI